MTPVILCGGSGRRLWPLSRAARPKPFLPLTEAHSPLQATLRRLDGIAGIATPLVVAGEDHLALVGEQLAEAGVEARILVEPQPRDTAPAIAAAAALLHEDDRHAKLLVLAADHHVGEAGAFRAAVAAARNAVAAGWIVTFGVCPRGPSTAYGYIEAGAALPGASPARLVTAFIEKPPPERAAQFVAAGHLWNSGNLAARADLLLAELEAHEPAVQDAAARAVAGSRREGGVTRLDAAAFAGAPAIPFDRAVLERTRRAATVPVDMDWSDIGAWNAVWERSPRDEAGNAVTGDVAVSGVSHSLVRAEGITVAAAGVNGLVIVATPDAVLVCRRDDPDAVRRLTDELTRRGRSDLL